MANISDVVEGLQIIAKYDRPNSHSMAAEHDVIYAGPYVTFDGQYFQAEHGSSFSGRDEKRLEELGWHVDSEFGRWARFV